MKAKTKRIDGRNQTAIDLLLKCIAKELKIRRLIEAGEHMKWRIESGKLVYGYLDNEDVDAIDHWNRAKKWDARRHVK